MGEQKRKTSSSQKHDGVAAVCTTLLRCHADIIIVIIIIIMIISVVIIIAITSNIRLQMRNSESHLFLLRPLLLTCRGGLAEGR